MKGKISINSETFTIEKGFELWLQNCKRRGLSQATIAYYNSVSNIIMDNVNFKTKIEDVSSETIDDFIFALQNKNVKTVSINSYLNGMRSICNWWGKEGYLVPFKIDRLKCDEAVKETFTEAETKILLKHPNMKNCTISKL